MSFTDSVCVVNILPEKETKAVHKAMQQYTKFLLIQLIWISGVELHIDIASQSNWGDSIISKGLEISDLK